MCGIAGIVGDTPDRELVRRMVYVMRHRGPNSEGYYHDEHAALGAARLAIIDLKTGDQPIFNEDRSILTVYNGECYNYRELRRILEGFGHSFSTESDTEVVVHAYEQYGDGFVQKLNGMFALAIWDSCKRKLILARDRLGIKPLYYVIYGGSIYFASEVKALLQASIPRAVNRRVAKILVALNYTPTEETLIQGIVKVMPAHMITYQEGQIAVHAYWSLPPISYRLDFRSIVKLARAALERAIQSQMVADVPVGAFLSGGLDTSSITAFASRSLDEPLKTFSMGFGEPTDELDDARLVAEAFGTDHREFTIDASQASKLFPRMIWHADAPKINLYSWFVDELASKYVKVCLSGLGGDELFAGYAGTSRFRRAALIDRMNRMPGKRVFRAVGSLLPIWRLKWASTLGVPSAQYALIAAGFPDSDVIALIEPLYEPQYSFIQNFSRIEILTKLPEDYLVVEDAMSMAHSLEVRVPLLDNSLLDLMIPVPYEVQATRDTGKLILREAMKDLLPKRCFEKPKQGFSVDVFHWYQQAIRDLAMQILPSSESVARYFDTPRLLEIAKKRPDPRKTRLYTMIWMAVSFHIWHQLFIESDHRSNISFNLDSFI